MIPYALEKAAVHHHIVQKLSKKCAKNCAFSYHQFQFHDKIGTDTVHFLVSDLFSKEKL